MSSRGGKRKNAGRKKSEPTVRMRVPESLVDEFRLRISSHKKTVPVIKEGQLKKTVPVIKEGQLKKTVPVIKEGQHKKTVPVIKEGQHKKTVPVIKEGQLKKTVQGSKLNSVSVKRRKAVSRLPKYVQRQLVKDYGSLDNALRKGLMIVGKKAHMPQKD